MTNSSKKHLAKLSRSFTQSLIGAILLSLLTVHLTSQAPSLNKAEESPQIYSNQNQEDLKSITIKAIESAESSILLIIFALNDQDVIEALNKQADKGLAINIIYDKKATKRIHDRLHQSIHKHPRYEKGIMHQKMLVIDEENIWIGSANFTQQSLRMHDNLIVSLKDKGMAADILNYSQYLMHKIKKPPFTHREYTIAEQGVELYFLPESKEALNNLRSMIQSAEKTVRVAMYTWTRRDLAKDVIKCADRGLDVGVALDGTSAYSSSKHVLKLFRLAKVPIRISNGPQLLHHKFVYIDNKTLVSGSANWTSSAFRYNDDCLLILHDMTEEQINVMDRVWEVTALESTP